MLNRQHRSIRQALAEHTRTAHETLHHHPWISCLTSPTLTLYQYSSVLNAYLQFYSQVEAERKQLNEFDSLNLREAIACLTYDTAAINGHQPDSASYQGITIGSTGEALGALYVLHGARFGAAILNKLVSKNLPDAPRQFLQNTTSQQQWRELTETIETLGVNDAVQKDMFLSADRTFSAFGLSVTEYCESANAEPSV